MKLQLAETHSLSLPIFFATKLSMLVAAAAVASAASAASAAVVVVAAVAAAAAALLALVVRAFNRLRSMTWQLVRAHALDVALERLLVE